MKCVNRRRSTRLLTWTLVLSGLVVWLTVARDRQPRIHGMASLPPGIAQLAKQDALSVTALDRARVLQPIRDRPGESLLYEAVLHAEPGVRKSPTPLRWEKREPAIDIGIGAPARFLGRTGTLILQHTPDPTGTLFYLPFDSSTTSLGEVPLRSDASPRSIIYAHRTSAGAFVAVDWRDLKLRLLTTAAAAKPFEEVTNAGYMPRIAIWESERKLRVDVVSIDFDAHVRTRSYCVENESILESQDKIVCPVKRVARCWVSPDGATIIWRTSGLGLLGGVLALPRFLHGTDLSMFVVARRNGQKLCRFFVKRPEATDFSICWSPLSDGWWCIQGDELMVCSYQ